MNNEFETSISDELPGTDIVATLKAKINAEIESIVKHQFGCGITTGQIKPSKSTKLWQIKGACKNLLMNSLCVPNPITPTYLLEYDSTGKQPTCPIKPVHTFWQRSWKNGVGQHQECFT